jgi:hypothetical protein
MAIFVLQTANDNSAFYTDELKNNSNEREQML